MQAERQRWRCGECREEWLGSEAVSASCPTCRSTYVKKLPPPRKLGRRATIAMFVFTIALHVAFKIAGHSLFESSKTLVRHALYWINENL